MIKRLPIEFSISPCSCILGALMVLCLPFELLLAAVAAAVVHEVCHLLALLSCRVSILQIKVGISGAVIRTTPLPPVQELLCAFAGPAGSLMCLCFAQQLPLLALCGFVQGLYNLLPVYPLDGGRILHCALQLCAPRSAHKLSGIIALSTTLLITLCCIALALHTKDVVFLILGVLFLSRLLPRRKISCKDGAHWVQ